MTGDIWVEFQAFFQGIIIPVLDVLLVAYLIYRILLVIRGTRAAPMLWGLTLLVLVFFLSGLMGLVTLNWILGNFLSSIIIVVIVVFQEEIRRGLTKMGLQQIFRKSTSSSFGEVVEELVSVSHRLAERKIGALIAIQREVGLAEFLEESIEIDALVSRKLLFSIFVRESPLHDGAVVIVDGRIKAAGCVLPLSFNPDLDPSLGTRHRAALGLSERCDALVIVVSEETGTVSVTRDGRLMRNLDPQMLRDLLTTHLQPRDKIESTEGETV
ncbi:MAG: diadenylate cyclase CdaA [Bdellovibrionota bacterium]